MEGNVELPGSLDMGVHMTDDRRHVRLRGELDGAEVPGLQPILDDAAPGERVVVDCSGLSFVDSMGLRLLVEWHRRLEELGGALVIRDPSGPLRRLLAATQLDSVMHVDSTTGDSAPDDAPPSASGGPA